MEQMRTDTKHQFEAQIVLSCAAAERRAKEILMHDQVAMASQAQNVDHHHNHGGNLNSDSAQHQLHLNGSLLLGHQKDLAIHNVSHLQQ